MRKDLVNMYLLNRAIFVRYLIDKSVEKILPKTPEATCFKIGLYWKNLLTNFD